MDLSISVIVPLYNKADYVRQMLLSIIPQLSEHDQLVVVDDCSTDAGPTKIADLLGDRVRLHKLECNSGPATARNYGASIATGKYLLFFDADDVADPRLLATLRAVFSKYHAESIFSFGIAYGAYGERLTGDLSLNGVTDEFVTVHGLGAFARTAIVGRPLCTASSTVVVRTAFVAAGGFSKGLRYCEDPELWVRLSSQYPIVCIAKVLAFYRNVPSSLSYGMRSRPGSVAPYVETLLVLADRHGEMYRLLAKSVVRKNILLSAAGPAKRLDLLRYLGSQRYLFATAEYFLLFAAAALPSVVAQVAVGAHGLLTKRIPSAVGPASVISSAADGR